MYFTRWLCHLAMVGTILLTSGFIGCGPKEDAPPVAPSRAAVTMPPDVPYLDFYYNPLNPKKIALTFDDGPDANGNTECVLDILRDYHAPATFFINTHNAMDVASGPEAAYGRWLIQRMISEGHSLGNHSDRHLDWAVANTNPEAELKAVETIVKSIARWDAANPPLYLARAPYGHPYDGPQDRLNVVAPIVARHGVHILWRIDPTDWACSTAQCVLDNVLSKVDQGLSGVILLHSTLPWTVEALPTLLDALWARGKYFVRVDDLVMERYGKTPRALVTAYKQKHPY